ncbi:hypothetical protein HZA96_00445 [Candidatus Woesearchaeota archaeon]|nr:hypothetical protein [Candidatus Woesearchaeota archaeon]
MAIFTIVQEGIEKSFSEEDMQKSAVAIAMQQHRKNHLEKHPDIPLQIKPLQESQGSGIDGSLNSDLTSHNQQTNIAHQQADNAQYTSNTIGKELLMPMGCACGERIMARFDANPEDKNNSKTNQYNSSTDYTNTFSGVFADFSYNNANSSYK